MKKIYALIAGSILCVSLQAQTNTNMPSSGTTNVTITCAGGVFNFYDSGGSSSNYGNNESGIVTYCTNDPCKVVRITWSAMTLKNNDHLYVYDGPNISSPLLFDFNGTTSAPAAITASGTCITFRFTSNNSQNDNGWAAVATCVTPTPTVANDLCCGAISLPVNAACSFTASGNVSGATQSLPGCGGGNADDDVWYSFVATGPLAYITVAPGASYNATVEVYSAPTGCGALTSLQCVNSTGAGLNENVSMTGLTTGQTYYVRVFNNTAGASVTPNFNICITNTIPCTLGSGSVAIGTLPYSSGATTTCGSIDDITASNVTNVCGSTSYYGGEDRIYSFTPATSGNINVNVTSAGSWMGIMLYQGCPTSGGTCVAYAQSSAGNQALGCVAVTAGVTYYLVVDSWPSPTCNAYTLTISAPSGGIPPGTTCGNPVSISLPYSATGESTSCMGNDYTNASTGSCATLYESGEDKVYRLVTTGPDCIGLEITGANSSSIGFQVYQGCPGVAGTTCIASGGGAVAGTLSGSFVVPSAGTYYIIIDSWNPPSNVTYNITVNSLGGSPANDLPCNAQALTLAIQTSGDNSCSGSASEPASPACWLTPNNLNTVWYNVVCPASGLLNIRVNPGTLTNTQMAVYSGTCVGLTLVNCNDNAASCGGASTNGSELILTGLTSGATYWIRIDGYGSQTGSFSVIAVDGLTSYPPLAGQDCALPNPVCQSSFSVSNPGYSGYGNNCDLPSSYCLASSERNVSWYTLPMNAAGNLVFDIIPNDFVCATNSSTDYDYAVFKWESATDGAADGMYSCTEIFNATATPAACNYSGLGVTGVGPNALGNAPATLSATVCPMCSSCGGYSPTPTYDLAYEPQIPVVSGDVYVIAVSNFSGSTSGFRIDFRTSPINYAAGIVTTSVTWSGGDATVPTLWTDPDNWGGCTSPSCTRDAQVAPFLNQPIITTGTTMYARDVTVQAGATLTLQAGATLEICGSFYNYGNIVMAPTSTLRFVGSAATQNFAGGLTGANKLGNVEVNKTAGQVLLLNDLEMGGNFTTINATSIFNSNQKYVTIAGNFNNFSGNTTYSTTGTTGTLEFNGTAAQNYNQGTSQLDLNFVIMNHTGPGVSLLTDMFIKTTTGTLTLNQGKISTAAFRVDVANSTPACVTTGNVSSYVNGNLWRTVLAAGGNYDFPVGTSLLYERAWISLSANTYTRLQSRFDAWPGSPNTQGGTECSVTYSLPSENMGYWTINQTGSNTGSYNTTLYCNGATNTSPASAWTVEKASSIAGPWILSGTCVASTATVVNRNGMSGFSVLAAAQAPNPLPVELTNFQGHEEDKINVLTWNTETEINNHYFVIEKSGNGVDYEDMTFVTGAGNSNTLRSYSAIDDRPYATTYYRLRQVDYDGQYVHYGPIVIANSNLDEFAVQQIYPNPADHSFFIDIFSKNLGSADVYVYDSYGRLVLQKNLQISGLSTFEIESSTWASGVYMIKIVNEEKQFQYISKIVIK